jgi:hypothetical protein
MYDDPGLTVRTSPNPEWKYSVCMQSQNSRLASSVIIVAPLRRDLILHPPCRVWWTDARQPLFLFTLPLGLTHIDAHTVAPQMLGINPRVSGTRGT